MVSHRDLTQYSLASVFNDIMTNSKKPYGNQPNLKCNVMVSSYISSSSLGHRTATGDLMICEGTCKSYLPIPPTSLYLDCMIFL